MVSRLDGYVGDVLALLDELQLADHTIVLFTSDNGAQGSGGWQEMNDYFGSSGGLRGYKGSFYEGGLRVPFLVRWPGRVAPGSTTDHVIGFQDILPTLCEMTGAATPSEIDGISFVPALSGSTPQDDHIGLYWEYPAGNRGIGRAARMGRWKAVQQAGREVELYDLAGDPAETTNVAAEHPAIVRELVSFMDGAHVPLRDYPGPGPQTGVADYVR
jgi:arylsulfatase A-like enzyme